MIKLPAGHFCSDNCAYLYATRKVDAHQQKHERKALRERKAAIKTRGEWLKDAQTAFNAYIRERDYDLPCISCGRFHQGQWHAGHYRAVGAHPELRFNELNVHKQCSACNNHKSGNLVEYRINLEQRIGKRALAWLEGEHPPQKLTIEQIQALTKEYRAKTRELKRDHQVA